MRKVELLSTLDFEAGYGPDSTPFRRRILRCIINLGNGESSPNAFLDVVNLYLIKSKER